MCNILMFPNYVNLWSLLEKFQIISTDDDESIPGLVKNDDSHDETDEPIPLKKMNLFYLNSVTLSNAKFEVNC